MKNQCIKTSLRFCMALLLVTISSACFGGPDIKERQVTAMRMWKERCESKAGIKIYRTTDDVEGIFLMKLRPNRRNLDDQFALTDPYGKDSSGDQYIKNFLRGFYHQRDKQKPAEGAPPRVGYRYVEAIDPVDGKRYRYTASIREVEYKSQSTGNKFKTQDFVLGKAPAPGKPPRYGVTYDDISTREEREYWIAGSSLKVIDLKTNEVLAERIGYMVDKFQGSRAGARSPWLFAADYACPSFLQDGARVRVHGATAQFGQTIDFVESVLKHQKD